MSKHGGGPLRRSPQAHHDSQCCDAKLESVSSERPAGFPHGAFSTVEAQYLPK